MSTWSGLTRQRHPRARSLRRRAEDAGRFPRSSTRWARALAPGTPCRVELLAHGPQFLRLPTGEQLYATKVRVVDDSSETQIFLPVPAGEAGLLQDAKQLPAKRVLADQM